MKEKIKRFFKRFSEFFKKNDKLILICSSVLLVCGVMASLLIKNGKNTVEVYYRNDGTVTAKTEAPKESKKPVIPLRTEGKYWHSSKSKKLHYSNCKTVNRIKEENRIYLEDEDLQYLVGFDCCKKCIGEHNISELPLYDTETSMSNENTEEITVTKEEAKYVRSKNSKVIHKIDCFNAKRIEENNRIYYNNDESIEGFRRCKNCWD